MDAMHAADPDTAQPTPQPRRRRRRWWVWTLAALAVFVAAGGIVWWWLTRPPAPVSVSDVLHKYRKSESAGSVQGSGPARGVYLYATSGSERISAGDITHTYPARTTLTVSDIGCGLRFRWDALAGRYSQLDMCRTADGWRLQHYVDAHKFLYMQDIHDYSCSGYPAIVCRTDSGVLTSTVETVQPGHLRIMQEATGKSLSTGLIEMWVLPSGLPRRVVVNNRGSQSVLGQQIVYTESATFTLTSTTPLR